MPQSYDHLSSIHARRILLRPHPVVYNIITMYVMFIPWSPPPSPLTPPWQMGHFLHCPPYPDPPHPNNLFIFQSTTPIMTDGMPIQPLMTVATLTQAIHLMQTIIPDTETMTAIPMPSSWLSIIAIRAGMAGTHVLMKDIPYTCRQVTQRFSTISFYAWFIWFR